MLRGIQFGFGLLAICLLGVTGRVVSAGSKGEANIGLDWGFDSSSL